MRTLQPLTLSQRRRTFLIRPACLLGLLVYATLCGPIAHASEVYAYLGSPYTSVYGLYTTLDFISGVFTTSSPLGPNLSSATITPTAYSFSDGVFDWTPSDSVIVDFEITTDSYATITAAAIQLHAPGGSPPFSLWSPYGVSTSGVLEILPAPYGDRVALDAAPRISHDSFGTTNTVVGKWGPDFDPSVGVPEPATRYLTLTALLAVAFRARTRIARGLRQSAPTHHC